jgi:hypothetical protein
MGVFDDSSTFEAKCAAPRSGNDPDGQPWPDVKGTATDEKMWLRSWTHDLYLWYREVPDVDPASYAQPCSALLNVGKAVTKGGELEVSAYPTSNLTLQGTLGYIDIGFKSLQAAAISAGTTLDSRFPLISKWKGSASAQYRIDTANVGTVTPRLDVSYQSSYQTSIPNSSFSLDLTNQARDRAAEAVAPVKETIRQGEVIVRNGSPLTATDIEKIDALGLRQTTPDVASFAPEYNITPIAVRKG